jgi:hypothetical protein
MFFSNILYFYLSFTLAKFYHISQHYVHILYFAWAWTFKEFASCFPTLNPTVLLD